MQRYAAIPSICMDGVSSSSGFPILIEARLQRGIPKFCISGFNGYHSKETSQRIHNAIQASGIQIPYMSLHVNLSPVDIRKSGAYLDLGIAMSIILSLPENKTRAIHPLVLPSPNHKVFYLGELSLCGEVRPVPQLHALLWQAKKQGFDAVVLARQQYNDAKIIDGIRLIPLHRLQDIFQAKLPKHPCQATLQVEATRPQSQLEHLELAPRVKKALALCVSGWHSLLLIGPPGSGKSSIARELISLLPPPSSQEAIEILINQTQNFFSPHAQAIAAKNRNPNITSIKITRPFRCPHHSSTRRAMIGGGNSIQAGEVTRAHNGVLLLDELGEFSRETLQSLREPLQEKKIQISKNNQSISLPARFLLCATTNPCPCGDLSNRYVRCACTNTVLKNYVSKFMGALEDRIDIEVWLDNKNYQTQKRSITTKDFYAKISQAHAIQKRRFINTDICFNAEIDPGQLDAYIPLKEKTARQEWQTLHNSSQISYRSLAGIRRLARTLADLEARQHIQGKDLLEAASYRCLESIWK